jgi:hypothetical protein
MQASLVGDSVEKAALEIEQQIQSTKKLKIHGIKGRPV